MERTVKEVADAVGAHLSGDGSVRLRGIASVALAGSGDLVFVEDETTLAVALKSGASAVIACEFAARKSSNKALLIHPQPRLAFSRAARLFEQPSAMQGNTHPSAVVSSSARLAKNVAVAEHAVIGENVEVGGHSQIGAGCVIGANVKIGRDCRIYPNVTIYPGVRLGDRVFVHSGAVLGSDGFGYVRDRDSGRYEKFPQIGQLEIEDDVEIGANSTIDRGALETTRIRRGVKIDNLVHVGHNCDVGEDVVIAAQTGLSGSVTIAKNVIMGGQVGIADHVKVGEGVLLGAQSGVPTKKIVRGKGIVFWGTPARPLREYLKQLAFLSRAAKKE